MIKEKRRKRKWKMHDYFSQVNLLYLFLFIFQQESLVFSKTKGREMSDTVNQAEHETESTKSDLKKREKWCIKILITIYSLSLYENFHL